MSDPNNMNHSQNSDETNSEWDSLQENSGEVENDNERTLHREIGKKILLAINFQESTIAKSTDLPPKGQYRSNETANGARKVDLLLQSFDAEKQKLTDAFQKSTKALTENKTKMVQDYLVPSLEQWSDHFTDEKCDLPTWFKVWAWNGMTTLGGYDSEKAKFNGRAKNTNYVFPPLNKEALAKTYAEVADSAQTKTANNDANFHYNFNDVYSKYFAQEIVKTPEFGETIKGGWKEYGQNSEAEISKAAEGSGWCIVSEKKAKEYLEQGDEAKFFFFHLAVPGLDDEMDKHACASIRLDGDGQVAEISGRSPKSGQMLEDSLVSTVKEKALSLPGGEEYAQAFEDREKILDLYHNKFSKGEELNVDDLKFIYGYDRDVAKLEKHSVGIPHVQEMQEKYGIDKLESALSIDGKALQDTEKAKLVECLMGRSNNEAVIEENVVQHLTELMKIDPSKQADYLKTMNPAVVIEQLGNIRAAGVSMETLVAEISNYPDIIAANQQQLLANGITSEQILAIATKSQPAIMSHLAELINLKNPDDQVADTIKNTEAIVPKMWPENILKESDILRKNGANIGSDEDIVANFDTATFLRAVKTIQAKGLSIEGLYDQTDPETGKIVKKSRLSDIDANEAWRYQDTICQILNDHTINLDIEKFGQALETYDLAFDPVVTNALFARERNDYLSKLAAKYQVNGSLATDDADLAKYRKTLERAGYDEDEVEDSIDDAMSGFFGRS